MKLPWKYCECGRKSFELRMGGKSFSLFWDLKDGWYLHVEGRGEKKFGSQEEAEAVVLEELKKSRPKLERELERMNKVLEEIDGTKV